ncbi:MAG: hypothetical protein QMD94_03815, partial [Candidatus Omnitrophota bacterium]|nr:hypothetical protein [Candidatus Omnitrophota bacterium]
LKNDFTVAHEKKLYQIENNIRTKKVIVEERTDGTVLVTYKGATLKFKEILTRPEKINQPKPCLPRQAYIPPADHPWRRFKINPQFPQYGQKEKGSQKEKELLLFEV